MRLIIFFISLTLVFVSCDPAQSFKIRNNSNNLKHIEVFLDKQAYFPYNGKIEIVSKGDSYEKSILKDTNSRSYSFPLPENSYALIRQGIALQIPIKVVVDQKDTILLDSKIPILNRASKTTLVAIEFD
jgi:hypothetical protein